jgi:Protein of unknown function (DUF998)
MSIVAAFLPLLALVYLFANLFRLSPRKPGYSQVLHTISELGEIGSPDQGFVAWGVFLPIGLAFLPGAFLFQASAPAVAALSLCIAVGYLVAAVVPCDPGSPVSGSVRQGIHNLGGAIEYIGGGFSLLTAARDFGAPCSIAGCIVLTVAVALTVLPAKAPRGLTQRIGELVLFCSAAWLMWIAADGV